MVLLPLRRWRWRVGSILNEDAFNATPPPPSYLGMLFIYGFNAPFIVVFLPTSALRHVMMTSSEMLARFREHQRKASIYYAYHTIQRYTDEPFTSYMPEALFNISRYLLHELVKDHPKVEMCWMHGACMCEEGKISHLKNCS